MLCGRINGGNVASLPLGLNFGWQRGELDLQYTLDKLFDGEFGMVLLKMKRRKAV